MTPSPHAPRADAGIPLETPLHVEEPFYVRRAERGLNLHELFDLLLRGKWIILASLLAVAVPMAVYAYTRPSLYESYVLLLVEKGNNRLASVLPEGGLWGAPQRNLGNELLVLRQSLPLARKAAAELLRHPRARRAGEPLPILQAGDDEAPPTVEEVAFRLQGGYISARMEDRDVDAIRITAVSTVPEEAALIANVYASAFVETTRDASRAGVVASREFLQTQVGQQEANVRRLDDAVREFMLREGAVALDQETSQLVSQLAQLQADRDEANVQIQIRQATMRELERELASARQELARVQPRLSEQLVSGTERDYASVQAQIVAVQGRLEPIYTRTPELRTATDVPEYVADLRRQLTDLQTRERELGAALARERTASGATDQRAENTRVQTLLSQIAAERVALSGLAAERNVLSARIQEYEGDLGSVPGQTMGLAQLERERLVAERLYQSLDQRLQETRVAEESELGYAREIRPAFASTVPFAPNRMRSVLLGVFLGFGLGIVLAVARVRLDRRIHRPDDLQSRGIPHIGTIPDVTDLIKKDFGGKDLVDVDGRRVDTHLISLLNPMATASETYRALRTSVQFSRPDVVVQTILITSSSPGEGKSMTASNLAVVMAQAGRRVLLLDADLRRPRVHKVFGLSREPGVVNQLFSDTPFDAAALAQPADDLFVFPAGTLAPNPSELLGSKRMRELIDELRNQFDVVIFDAPPVLAATDAVLLSSQADATIVVVRAGQTKDYDLLSSLEALQGVGAQVIGTVLNGFDYSNAYGYRYKYAYRYGQDYAYGHPESEPK